ncbi:MAG TPA: redoxin domain-containing protein [Rubrobacteraceae bacterium]|nr:redoxin domain-containing protein [Rubrobacteraceae bacterium]
MRSIVPHPVLLTLTLILIAGAISFVQIRFKAADASDQRTQSASVKPSNTEANGPSRTAGLRTVPEQGKEDSAEQERSKDESPIRGESIAQKQARYPRAHEIVDPTGFINTDGISLADARGKVVLLEFWTYSCYNCQNAQPHINRFYERYDGEGLQVIGIHKPEFEFEKDYASVSEAVKDANIQYPVALDNNDATWNAYSQRYWPTWYLIDADGFVRYKHIGEGAYDETEKKIQELLAERDLH